MMDYQKVLIDNMWKTHGELLEEIPTSNGTMTRVTNLGPGDSFKHLPGTKITTCYGCGAPKKYFQCEYCGGQS